MLNAAMRKHVAYATMEEYIKEYLDSNADLKILDVGSMEISGSFKEFFDKPNWEYYGLDLNAGPNVDIVASDPWHWPIKDNSFDVVISGQCLEHVQFPWLWIKEVHRVCKLDGIAIISVPYSFKPHYYPVDCWRILEDGMLALMRDWAGFNMIKCERKGKKVSFTFGVGRK